MTEQTTPSAGARSGSMRDDDVLRGSPTADGDATPGVPRPVAWLGLMVLLLAGFALMGAAFTDGNGLIFAAGILVSGLAFLLPLATGHHER